MKRVDLGSQCHYQEKAMRWTSKSILLPPEMFSTILLRRKLLTVLPVILYDPTAPRPPLSLSWELSTDRCSSLIIFVDLDKLVIFFHLAGVSMPGIQTFPLQAKS